MIAISLYSGSTSYLHPDAIAEVTEAGTSSQWHGIRSHIRLFDGRTLESTQTALEIANKIEKQEKVAS